MKKIVLLIALVLVYGPTLQVNAALIDRGNGMIYDTDLNVTWLQDANYAQTSGFHPTGRMTWNEANTWAESLVFGGFDDWRLPHGDLNCGTGNNFHSSTRKI